MSDLPPDEPPAESTPVPPTYADILAALALPADAKAVVMTTDAAYAVAADYPEPYTPPQEA